MSIHRYTTRAVQLAIINPLIVLFLLIPATYNIVLGIVLFIVFLFLEIWIIIASVGGIVHDEHHSRTKGIIALALLIMWMLLLNAFSELFIYAPIQ